jgi:hypothetical protein
MTGRGVPGAATIEVLMRYWARVPNRQEKWGSGEKRCRDIFGGVGDRSASRRPLVGSFFSAGS